MRALRAVLGFVGGLAMLALYFLALGMLPVTGVLVAVGVVVWIVWRLVSRR